MDSHTHLTDGSNRFKFTAFPQGEVEHFDDNCIKIKGLTDNTEIKFSKIKELEITEQYDMRGLVPENKLEGLESLCHVPTLKELYSNLNDFPELDIIDTSPLSKYCKSYTSCHWGSQTLSIWNSIVYIVSDDTKKIISVLVAPRYDLQTGDLKTNIYLIDDKDIIVWNKGDVWSLVLCNQGDLKSRPTLQK